MRLTRSTPTRATTRSRTSRRTFPCASRATSCARTPRAPAAGAGGIGTVRQMQMLADGGFSLEGDGAKHAPPALFGGEDGTPGAVILNAGDEGERELPSKFPYRKAAAGERLLLVAPSGGGYGEPAERDPAAVRDDVPRAMTPGSWPGARDGPSIGMPRQGSTGQGGLMTVRRWMVLLVVVAAAGGLAACGDDDDEGAATADGAGSGRRGRPGPDRPVPRRAPVHRARSRGRCRGRQGQGRRDHPGVEQRALRDHHRQQHGEDRRRGGPGGLHLKNNGTPAEWAQGVPSHRPKRELHRPARRPRSRRPSRPRCARRPPRTSPWSRPTSTT